MEWLQKFLGLPSERRGLLLTSVLALFGVRAALVIMPYTKARACLHRIGYRKRLKMDEEEYIRAVSWAVEVVARRFDRAITCLSKAMVAEWLLFQSGIHTELCVGVNAGEKGVQMGFHAHAWLTHRGQVIVGVIERLDRYRVFSGSKG